uniref:Tubulin polyglutamylase TTLL4 n=1 Tax=Romanomermis culicivorax TaxID=13658 RepID=A0A915I491_ROMCU
MVAICDIVKKNDDDSAATAATSDDNSTAMVRKNSFVVSCKIINHRSTTNKTTKKLSLTSSNKMPFFRPSLFSNVPPTIRFCLHDENKVQKPKKSIRKLLKWRHNSLTPRVIRRALLNSHFEIVDADSRFWIGYWGRHWKTPDFRQLLPYQKVNHFAGAFNLGRKDKLWTNIDRLSSKNVKNGEFSLLMPKTYILPHDLSLLKQKMSQDGQLTPYILKPPASARGTGIHVVHRSSQIPRKKSLVAQTYIYNPLLLYGSKFDLRIYVYVTSFNPLKIYLYQEGLVRFASVKYSKCLSTITNRLMHLTNYSLNKSAAQDENIENRSETGVKWSLTKFWNHLKHMGKDVDKLQNEIIDLIIKTFICCETPINSYMNEQISITRCIKILRFTSSGSPYSANYTTKPWCNVGKDTSLHQKEAFYIETFEKTGKIDPTILDDLTGEDLRILIDLEDEYQRRGDFVRIFPDQEANSRYLHFFETNRYANLLLDEWLNQYFHIRETGLKLLEEHCKRKAHVATKRCD